MNRLERIVVDRVAGGVADDAQGLEHRDARREQRAERARETRDAGAARERAEDGERDGQLVHDEAPALRLCPQSDEHHESRDADCYVEEVVLEHIADRNDDLRNLGEALAGEEVREDFLEFRNDREEQEDRNANRGAKNHRRVDHRALDLVLDLLGLLHEFGKAREDKFRDAAGLAGFDHVHEEVVEDLGVVRERLGEGVAAFDGFAHSVKGVLEGGVDRLALKHAKASEKRKARIHQRGELAGEGRQVLLLDFRAEHRRKLDLHLHALALGGGGLGRGGLPAVAAADLADGCREKVLRANLGNRLRLRRRLNRAAYFLAAGVHRDVVEFGHVSVSRKKRNPNGAFH